MKSFIKTTALILILALTYNCSSDSNEPNKTLPTLTTKFVFETTANSAKSGADISSDGGSEIISKGLVYNTSPNPTLENSVKNAGNGNASFYLAVDALLPNTTYYIKSYATNSIGTAYGQQETFTTLSLNFATLTTIEAQSITNNAATIGGIITNNGNSAITSKGIVWSTNPNPTILDNKAEAVNNSFSLQINNLNRNTTYYARAFAINSLGPSYGQEITFHTSNSDLMFSTRSKIFNYILQNKRDKILYMFTYDFDEGYTSNFIIIAYDYVNKRVIQQRSISQFVTQPSAIHSINSYNNQMELYIVSNNAVTILDPITLQTIDTINFPVGNTVISAVQKDGILFISYTEGVFNGTKIAAYNRNTLTLVNNTSIYAGFATISVCKDPTNPNQIKCFCFPQEQGNLFEVLTYDNNGTYLYHTYGGDNYGEGNMSFNRDDLPFIIRGSHGRIHSKNNLDNNSTTLIPLNESLSDYIVSDDGNYIYTVRRNPNYYYKIVRYNTTNFTIDSTIPISERDSENILIDGNNFIIIDYDYYSTTLKNVFISIY